MVPNDKSSSTASILEYKWYILTEIVIWEIKKKKNNKSGIKYRCEYENECEGVNKNIVGKLVIKFNNKSIKKLVIPSIL